MPSESEKYTEKLAEMIRCETVSEYGVKNKDKFRCFHILLEKLFPNLFKVCEKEDFDGSFLLRWKGSSNSGMLPIMLMSHFDVVEATGNWKYPPFEGIAADGKLWGRGTLDTKGSLFCILQAADELIAEGYTPNRDVYFESACTEETDGSGAEKISEELKKRNLKFDFIIDEGGYIVYDPIGGANGDYAMIGVGEKGFADIKFIARSNGGHSSMPGKNTPLVRLGKFMAEADKGNCFYPKISDTVKETFRRLSLTMTGSKKFLFSHIDQTEPEMKYIMPNISPAAEAMVKTTLAFTMAEGSNGTNVMPNEAWVIGNMRFSHHQDRKASIEAISNLAKKFDIETVIIDPGIESGVSDFRSKNFIMLEKAINEFFRGVIPTPYIMTGASDCRYFSDLSDCCLRFIPIKVDEQQLKSIHGLDENISVDALEPAVKFYKKIIKGE